MPPRKYAGPLMPNQRSAYVKGSRKKKVVASKKKAPTTKAGLDKEIKRVVKATHENRYSSMNAFDNFPTVNPPLFNQRISNANVATVVPRGSISTLPNAAFSATNVSTIACTIFQTGAGISDASEYLNTQTVGVGSLNTNQTSTVSLMGGYSLPQNTSATGITGEYALDNYKCIKLRIMANLVSNIDQINYARYALEFRVIGFQATKNIKEQDFNKLLLADAMFINEDNEPVGLASSATPYEMNHLWKTNPRRIKKFYEERFTLNNPIQPTADGDFPANTMAFPLALNNRYPSTKDLSIKLPVPKKKLIFNQTGTFEPRNYDFHNYIVVLATRKGNDVKSVGANYWDVVAHGISTFKDV